MSLPEVGATMRAYCDCANKKRDESSPVIACPVETTWVCNRTFEHKYRVGLLLGSASIFRYDWKCSNCGKGCLIGFGP